MNRAQCRAPRATILAAASPGHRFIGPLPALDHPADVSRLIAAVFWSSGADQNCTAGATTIALFLDEYMCLCCARDGRVTEVATYRTFSSALIVVGLATRLATLPLLGINLRDDVSLSTPFLLAHSPDCGLNTFNSC